MCCPACHCPFLPGEVQRYQMPGGVAFWVCPMCYACFPPATAPVPEQVDDVLSDRDRARRQAVASDLVASTSVADAYK